MKGETDKSITTLGDFNTSFLIIDKTTGQVENTREDLNNTNQLDLMTFI